MATHCSTWAGDQFISTNCSSTVTGDTRSHALLEDQFLSCMAGRGHFHFGSGYNLAQPSSSEQWYCRDAVGINCATLSRSHEIREKQRRGETLSGDERKFLYDQEAERIKNTQRALGMIE